MMGNYDLIIIGAGPAGLSASIYASRYKLNHLVLGVSPGGQMGEIYEIENYPGFPSISGRELIEKFLEHSKKFGAEIRNESVVKIKKNETGLFEVETSFGIYQAQALIMAMGAVYRKMNIPGEKEYTGKGVSYCATCDAIFFKGKTVSVVGGGNSAVVVALELADFAKKVYLIHRGEKMSAEPAWLEKLNNLKNLEILKDNEVLEIKGKEKVEKIILTKPFNDKVSLSVDGVFIEVGTDPGVELAKKIGVETDEQNYIKVNADMSTNIAGIFGAGDITNGSNKFRQVLSACAEGALAAVGTYKMLKLK
ncbi:MAG: hypothetical protein COZ85_02215 [Candidatus Moranbacteria bacterium CG_4_8_14_3_um_filter_34_16]|nr:MAG: hypothetical protein COT31_01950 [Candidatus Moranbacteria bacterium CG08_land_8_20_14_0_20_34_16]PIW95003.1 MAG: hypothetical protein COZ85_02215 [Candidatus Moranbacteria bacterium CG_4_8_14_3_um_filter_34_16]PJA89035.1 MAG: hypothetical protein CO138_02600 [Candidatus Moranbacteria bacterium CG_4_9_14_3_um_filter_33_15]